MVPRAFANFARVDAPWREVIFCPTAGPLEAHGEKLSLGHLFDGEANPLASEAGVFSSPVGHGVDPERGGLVDDETAYAKPVKGLPHPPEVAREDRRLQAVA